MNCINIIIIFNIYIRTFVNKTAVKTVGQKCLQIKCLGKNKNRYQCRGLLYDTILDWEHQLPADEFELAELHSG